MRRMCRISWSGCNPLSTQDDVAAALADWLDVLWRSGDTAAMTSFLDRLGLVADVFDETTVQGLAGHSAIGHVRYSTAGKKGQTQIRDVQPFFGEFSMGGAAISHNGNITNAEALRRELDRPALELAPMVEEDWGE